MYYYNRVFLIFIYIYIVISHTKKQCAVHKRSGCCCSIYSLAFYIHIVPVVFFLLLPSLFLIYKMRSIVFGYILVLLSAECLLLHVSAAVDENTLTRSTDSNNNNDDNDTIDLASAETFVKFSRDLYLALGSKKSGGIEWTDAEIVEQFRGKFLDLDAGGRITMQEVFRALYQVYTIRSLELALSVRHLEHYADVLHLLAESY